MEKNIAVIWGDCSSPEIVKQTIRVLDKVAEKYVRKRAASNANVLTDHGILFRRIRAVHSCRAVR